MAEKTLSVSDYEWQSPPVTPSLPLPSQRNTKYNSVTVSRDFEVSAQLLTWL